MKELKCKRTLLILACVIMFFMITWFAVGAEPNSVAFNNEDAYTLDGEFKVSVGSEIYMVKAPTNVEADAEDTISITKVLDKGDIKGNSIMFYVRGWRFRLKQRKLNYRFHNPNSAEDTANYLCKILIEANAGKVERVLQEAMEKCTEESEYIVEPEKMEMVEEPVSIRLRRAR